MEVIVIPAGASAWRLENELGRHLGDIDRVGADTLVVKPGHLLSDVHTGPFLSLSLAMSEIGHEAHGTCHLADDK